MNNAGTTEHHHRHDSSIGFSSGTNLVLAIWLLISPWVVGYSSTQVLWNNVIVAAVVLVFAVVRLGTQSRAGAPSWLNTVAGLWLIVSPFVFQNVSMGQKWNCIVVGTCVALLAITSGAAGASRSQ